MPDKDLKSRSGPEFTDEDGEAQPEETRRCYAAALRYRHDGLNVVPKNAFAGFPAVKWKKYQERYVTHEEMVEHFHLYQGGVGFITGAISNRVVLDTDGPEGEVVLAEFEKLHGPIPETYTIRSGSGRGYHRHFLHPSYKVKTVANTSIKLDIKGDGGFCVLPPTLHKSGGRYEVVKDVPPVPLPDGLLEFIEDKAAEAMGGALPAAAQDHDDEADGFEPNIFPIESTPPPLEAMSSMLELLTHKNVFEHRNGIITDSNNNIVKIGWRECGMALKIAYGDEDGFELWSITHEDDQARADAPAQWASFSSVHRPGDITIGTIIKASRDARCESQPMSSVLHIEKFTGNGFDVFNGRRFATMYRNKLLHIYETREWLIFDQSQGWISAPPGEEDRAAKQVFEVLKNEAADRYREAGPDDSVAKKMIAHVAHTSKAKNIRAIVDMAMSEPGMTVNVGDFDADTMLLGVTNGVLDLKTGRLMQVSPTVLVSKRCNVPYDPLAICPRFDRFMAEIQPDADVRQFLLRFLGYCLTGGVEPEVFAFFYGHGGNGKSKLLEVIAWLLGDYVKKIQTEMLMQHQRNPQGPSPDIVGLKGRRLIYANETEEGKRFSEARVKDLTGGDTLTGRVPHGKADVSFFPSHKLIIVGNYKPEISDTSTGMWRRVALVPFEQTIPEGQRDMQLLEKLKREGAGILNRLLAGLSEYQAIGLRIPKKIRAATEAYRDEQDILGAFISERCDTGEACTVKKDALYTAYTDWTAENGHRPLSKTKLTQRLKDRGYGEDLGRRYINGVAIKGEHIFGRNL